MKDKPLYMIREDDGDEYLSMERDGVSSRPATPEECSLEEMAALLDQDAENVNAHDFVGCHVKLAALLFQDYGRQAATRTFRRLVNYRGLHGMEGVCGRGDPEAVRRDLKLPKSPGDKLIFKDIK